MSNPLQTYLGLKLSLISKSGCRYVGILHSISQEDATVSLREVTSMGTENRPAPQFIPAAPQVFDFIVFKGSDVQDLSVMNDQPAPPPPVSQLPNDPAIMHAGGQPQPGAGFGGIPPHGPPVMQPQYMMGYPQQQPVWNQPSVIPGSGVQTSEVTDSANSSLSQPKGQVAQSSTQSPAKQALSVSDGKPSAGVPKKQDVPQTRKKVDGDGEKVESAQGQSSTDSGRAKGKDELTYAQVGGARKFEGENGHVYRGGANHARGRGGHRGVAPNNRGGHMRNLGPRNKVAVPDADFDFETANAKFNKMDLAKEKDGDQEEESAHPVNDEDDELGLYYNKTKSFFDNISCEAKERSESTGDRVNRRARQYEERRLNLETFGQMGVDSRGYRRGGRGAYTGGRGYGGGYGGGRRGGFRGGLNYGRGYYNGNHASQAPAAKASTD